MTAIRAISLYEVERNKPMPTHVHGVIQANLVGLLMTYRKLYGIVSEITLATNPKTTPDVCVLKQKKALRSESESKMQEAPLITIEIQSPTQSIEVLQRKAIEQYFPMGVQAAWIIIPALKGVQVLFPDGSEQFYNDGVIKDVATGIEVEVEKVFEDIE
jgi:Uma2 family endonuclease